MKYLWYLVLYFVFCCQSSIQKIFVLCSKMLKTALYSLQKKNSKNIKRNSGKIRQKHCFNQISTHKIIWIKNNKIKWNESLFHFHLCFYGKESRGLLFFVTFPFSFENILKMVMISEKRESNVKKAWKILDDCGANVVAAVVERSVQ